MAKSKADRVYTDVPANPVKSFFVRMLTRDISLPDAILDLLDNCVDGILRSTSGQKLGSKPYAEYYAHIDYDSTEFSITDNCGGIPWRLHDYAFRMGRADKNRDSTMPTVGVYGIGMKRAIFKIGKQCLIQTQSGRDAYDIDITQEWIRDEDEWKIPVKASSRRMKQDGTTILIGALHEGVKTHFGTDKALFDLDFKKRVATSVRS
jgi:hypothetical protein